MLTIVFSNGFINISYVESVLKSVLSHVHGLAYIARVLEKSPVWGKVALQRMVFTVCCVGRTATSKDTHYNIRHQHTHLNYEVGTESLTP